MVAQKVELRADDHHEVETPVPVLQLHQGAALQTARLVPVKQEPSPEPQHRASTGSPAPDPDQPSAIAAPCATVRFATAVPAAPAPEPRHAQNAIEMIGAGKYLNRSEPPVDRATIYALDKKFERSFEPVGKRSQRTSKVPESIALKIKQDKTLGKQYFNTWYHCGEDWGEVAIVDTYIHEFKKGLHCKREWMTELELEIKYKNPDIVAAVKKLKKHNDDSWRPNPDCPDCVAAVQYLVIDDDGDTNEITDIERSETRLNATVDQEAGMAMLPSRLQQGGSSRLQQGGSSSNIPSSTAAPHEESVCEPEKAAKEAAKDAAAVAAAAEKTAKEVKKRR